MNVDLFVYSRLAAHLLQPDGLLPSCVPSFFSSQPPASDGNGCNNINHINNINNINNINKIDGGYEKIKKNTKK